ncbi:MAG: heavy metal sensor histidine kinase [Thermomicrobiales bacterium]|nr:heavy metal sensor histidine kinase [Thermomicrobiales bacterium]
MTRKLPIRWHLTVWNAGLLFLCLVVFGAMLYGGLRYFLFANFDEQVASQGRLTVATLRGQNLPLKLESSTLTDLQNSERFVRILNSDGTIIQDPGNSVASIPVDISLVQRANEGDEPLALGEIDDQTMVYVTLPVTDNAGAVIAVLQTGISRDDIDDLLGIVQISLLLLAPGIIIAAVAAGYVVAGRALQPIAEITNLAASISDTDLGARLDLDLPNDERGRLAQTFNDMLARMENAFTRQRQFSSTASHELRTPLSLLRSRIDLALSRPREAEDYRAVLTELDVDVARLSRLVDSLLSLTRSDHHGLVPERSEVAVHEILRSIGEQYEDVAAERAIGIAFEIESVDAYLDPDLLIQLLVNLMDNALLHSDPQDVITLGCRHTSVATEIWVRDTGRGIPPEHHERIFERFYRVDPSRSRDSGGAGLGLAIVKSIVDAHGGEITITSELDQGTTFFLRFPDAENLAAQVHPDFM